MATDWKDANIYEKLFEVQCRVEHFSKSERNDQQGFRYVKASEVTDAIRGAFNEVGIVILFDQTDSKVQSYKTAAGKTWWFTELQATVTFVNVHKPDEKVSVRFQGQGTDSGEKGVGKALSYALKYGLFRQFLISTDEDDPERPQKPPQGRQEQRGGQAAPQRPQVTQTPPAASEQPPASGEAGASVANPISLKMVGRMLAIARTQNYQMKDLWAVITFHIADFNRPGNLKGDEFKEAIALQIEKVTYDPICAFLEAGNVVPDPGAQAPQEPGPEQYPTDDDIPF